MSNETINAMSIDVRDWENSKGEISFRFNWRKSVKSAYLATKNIM